MKSFASLLEISVILTRSTDPAMAGYMPCVVGPDHGFDPDLVQKARGNRASFRDGKAETPHILVQPGRPAGAVV